MNKQLFRRRQMLAYFGLGMVGTGVAATLLHQKSNHKLSDPLMAAKRSADAGEPSSASIPSAPSAMQTAMQTHLPEFQGISQWLNSEPLTVSALKGSVVLIQFWTFACINCQRTLPYLTEWHRQYAAQGLKVIGVHTPEFAFEREIGNVEAALVEHQITYPVPIDGDFATWKAYDNRFWPHLFLADREGVIQYDHIGEGAYDETEQVIRQLLG
jgi:thiol-disulfide isomerase/thioredoxin